MKVIVLAAALATISLSGPSFASNQDQLVWINGSTPSQATLRAEAGDEWLWSLPTGMNGDSPLRAHQSNIGNDAVQQHYFYDAPPASALAVGADDTLFAYVYLDPLNPPAEVMLQWNDGTWEHRAFWGDNLVQFGASGTQSRLGMGALPSAGGWVRLEVPASAVGLGGRSLNGMAFTLWGGRATWERAGVSNGGHETPWVDGATPDGATLASSGGDAWNWVSAPAPFAGPVHLSASAPGEHQHYFLNAAQTMPVSPGDTLFAYVWLDPATLPSEIMLQWHDAVLGWEHRAYWGSDLIGFGAPGTAAHVNFGALPATGQWVRLEVPAETVGLPGTLVDGMAFTIYDGGAVWDQAGKVGHM